jgi:hypothetical protein
MPDAMGSISSPLFGGSDASTERISAFGVNVENHLGRSVPCVLCRRELVKFDFDVHMVKEDGSMFVGKLTDDDAPASKPTSVQLHNWSEKKIIKSSGIVNFNFK